MEQNENKSKENNTDSIAMATKDKTPNNPGLETTNTHTVDVEISPEVKSLATMKDVDVGIRSNGNTTAHDEIRFMDDSSTDTEKGSPSTPVAMASGSMATNTTIATRDSEPTVNSKHNSKHKLSRDETPTSNTTETPYTHNALHGSQSDIVVESGSPEEQLNINTTDKNHNIDVPSVEMSDLPLEHEKFLISEREGKTLEVKDMTNVNQKMPITKL